MAKAKYFPKWTHFHLGKILSVCVGEKPTEIPELLAKAKYFPKWKYFHVGKVLSVYAGEWAEIP